ncbi:MAG: LLM class flavin-dependent oxidoreductase [Candidatus Rokubacteria bacterium]|nr:LLM class flavin-dependent oxidoreductase [Candidatus Rokubacteria bacterium]
MTTRVGIATGYDPALDVRAFAGTAREVDERGYEIAFFSETLALMRDSVTAMAAFALASRRITLGCTQVVRLRGPVTMAQTLASLDELSGGRMVLCPGAATALHARRFGFPPVDPPTALAEWVEAIRLVLTGERVSYKGTTVAFEDAELGWTPLRRRVPLWIAATSATGLRLAGRIGDGVLLNTVASPEYSANAIRIARQAAEEAGRDWASFEVAQLINTSVEDAHAAALDAVRWEVATKFYPAKFRSQAGPRLRVGEPSIDPAELPRLEAAFARGGPEGLAQAIPPSWIEGLTASGTPDEVVRRVERYREAGVKLPILRPAAAHQSRRIIDLFAPR